MKEYEFKSEVNNLVSDTNVSVEEAASKIAELIQAQTITQLKELGLIE